jgi:hypothetical protein
MNDNCRSSLPDLVQTLASLWNERHEATSILTYIGYDIDKLPTSGRYNWPVYPNPLNIVEFDLRGGSTLGAPKKISVNLGKFIPTTPAEKSLLVGQLKKVSLVEQLNLSTPSTQSAQTSTASKVIAGVAVTAAISAAALWAYAYYQKITFGSALYKVVGRFAKENPIAVDVPRRRTSKGRRLAYRVRLDASPSMEYVQVMPDGSAILLRHGHQVAKFRPTTYQLPKIHAGDGELLIFVDQLI